MPANFTAVNSEVVYGGADLFSVLADTTAPVWGAANVKQFNTNVITLISNTLFSTVTANTLGVMFGGNWGGDDGVKMFGDDGSLKNGLYSYDAGTKAAPDIHEMNGFNKVMRTIGAAAVVYTLGTAPATINFVDGPKTFDLVV